MFTCGTRSSRVVAADALGKHRRADEAGVWRRRRRSARMCSRRGRRLGLLLLLLHCRLQSIRQHASMQEESPVATDDAFIVGQKQMPRSRCSAV